MAAIPAPDPDRYPGAPRWVKVTGIVALVVVLLVIVVLVFGPSEHGPRRHTPSFIEPASADGIGRSVDALDEAGTTDATRLDGVAFGPGQVPVLLRGAVAFVVIGDDEAFVMA